MIDMTKLIQPDYAPEAPEYAAVRATLHRAAEILETAERTPDEAVKKPLVQAARQLTQNCLDALKDDRREMDEEDE